VSVLLNFIHDSEYFNLLAVKYRGMYSVVQQTFLSLIVIFCTSVAASSVADLSMQTEHLPVSR
jgi:hypothetical protein